MYDPNLNTVWFEALLRRLPHILLYSRVVGIYGRNLIISSRLTPDCELHCSARQEVSFFVQSMFRSVVHTACAKHMPDKVSLTLDLRCEDNVIMNFKAAYRLSLRQRRHRYEGALMCGRFRLTNTRRSR